MPVLDTQVSLVSNTTDVDYDTEDDEADASADFDHGENELDFAIATNSKYLDGCENKEEDRNPNAHVKIISPERDCEGGGDKLKGQDS